MKLRMSKTFWKRTVDLEIKEGEEIDWNIKSTIKDLLKDKRDKDDV